MICPCLTCRAGGQVKSMPYIAPKFPWRPLLSSPRSASSPYGGSVKAYQKALGKFRTTPAIPLVLSLTLRNGWATHGGRSHVLSPSLASVRDDQTPLAPSRSDIAAACYARFLRTMSYLVLRISEHYNAHTNTITPIGGTQEMTNLISGLQVLRRGRGPRYPCAFRDEGVLHHYYRLAASQQ